MKHVLKGLTACLAIFILAGCATHADIKMPVVSAVQSPKIENKTIHYEAYYSQPKPGAFTGGEQLPMSPLEEAELSIASAATLKDLPKYLSEQLPASVSLGTKENSDYQLRVEVTAHNKLGPSYADHQFAKSLGKGLLTLGLAPSDYAVIADFGIAYTLTENGRVVFQHAYDVKDQVAHQRGDFEGYNSVNDPAGQLLKKHIILTMNDFFSRAVTRL